MGRDKLREFYEAVKADGAPMPETFEEFAHYMTSGPQNGYEHRKQVYDALKADGAPMPGTYEEFVGALFRKEAPVTAPQGVRQIKADKATEAALTERQRIIDNITDTKRTQGQINDADAGQQINETADLRPINADEGQLRQDNGAAAGDSRARLSINGGAPLQGTAQKPEAEKPLMAADDPRWDTEVLAKNGGKMPLWMAHALVLDDKAKPEDFAVTAQEREDLKKRQEAYREQEKAFDSGVWVTLKDGSKMPAEEYDARVATDIDFMDNLDYDPRQHQESKEESVRLERERRTKGRPTGTQTVIRYPERLEGESAEAYYRRKADSLRTGFVDRQTGETVAPGSYVTLDNPADIGRITGKVDDSGTANRPFDLPEVKVNAGLPYLQKRLKDAEGRLKELLAQRDAANGGRVSFAFGAGQSMTPHASVSGATMTELDKAIEQTQAEVLKLSEALRKHDERTRADSKGVFGKIFQGVYDGLRDPNSWTGGVLGMSVGSTASRADAKTEAGRKLLESFKASEDYLATAPDAGGFYNGGRFAGEMLGDPVTYVSSLAGGAAKSAVTRGTERLLAGKVGKEVAERLAANSLGLRLAGHASGTGFNLATFEGLRDMRQQVTDGGWRDKYGIFHDGFSWSHALKQGGHGLMLGTAMGLFGAGVGNVGDWAVRQAGSATGKAAVRAAQYGLSFVGEGTIFAAPEIIVFQTMDDEKFDRLYAGEFGYDDERDAERRAQAREAARNSLSWDAWTDSQAMVFGMKVAGKAMHARRVVGDVKSTLSKLRREGERDHRSFGEIVSAAMESPRLKQTLTADERRELREAGYGRLTDLFSRSEEKQPVDEEVTEPGAVDYPRAEAEEIGRKKEFDGYDEIERLMDDRKVSQAARAKVYFILTGRMLPMGKVSGSNVEEMPDGSLVVRSMTAEGEVVTSRRFRGPGKRGRAQAEIDRIDRQAELNTIDAGEQYAYESINLVVMDEVKADVARRHRLPEVSVELIYGKYFRGEELSQAEMEIVDDVHRSAEGLAEKYRSLTPESIRADVEAEFGVSIDDELRRQPYNRDDNARAAVEEYARRLYTESERQRLARAIWEKEAAAMREEAREERRRAWRMQTEGRLLAMRYEQGDAEVAAEAAAEAADRGEELRRAMEACEDAFGADAEYWMARMNENPWEVLDDAELTDGQRQTVLDYINAKAVIDGIEDAAEDAAGRKRAQVKRTVEKRTHDATGMIIPATMKVDDRQVYVVHGDVVMFADGKGVDERNSSRSVVVADAETGDYKFASPDQILEVSEAVDPAQELEAAYAAIEQESEGLAAAARAAVQGGAEAPAQGQINKDAENAPLQEEQDVRPDNADKGQLIGDNEAVPVEDDGFIPVDPSLIPAPDGNGNTPAEDTRERTALERVPVDENGRPLWTRADADTAWDALVEKMGGAERAGKFARMQTGIAEKALTKAQKAKSPETDDADAFMAAEDAREAAIKAAQEQVDAWKRISGVEKRRADEAEKAEREAREEAERQEREAARREAERRKEITGGNKELARVYDECRDYPEALEILENMDPTDIYEAAAVVLSRHRILSGSHSGRKSYRDETGFGPEEERSMFGQFASAEKGGRSIEELAEDEMKETCEEYGIPYDNGEARDALIDVLQSARTRSDITGYIRSNRIAQARDMANALRRMEEDYARDAFIGEMHITPEEYETYLEVQQEYAEKALENFDEAEYNSYIAGELAAGQEKRIENDTDRRDFTDDAATESAADGPVGELVSEEGIHSQARAGAGEADGGRSAEVRGTLRGDGVDVAGEIPGQRGVAARSGAEGDSGGGDTGLEPLGKDRNDLYEDTPEEAALRARISVGDEWEEEGPAPDKPIYKRKLYVDGKHEVIQTDAPGKNGSYTGSQLTFDGRDFGDLKEIADYIDGGMQAQQAEPTEAQKAAGNYKMEHRRVDGYNISIENAKGSVRRGTGADGKSWETLMHNDYGYIRGTEGVDGDHIDVFLSDTPEEGDVFVVDQVNEDGSFDEHKIMYGFPTEQAARDAYLSNYEPGWTGLGAITHVSKNEFKKWIQSSRRKTKPFAEYKSVKPIGYDSQGNPIDENGNLIIEDVKSVADITDADFTEPTRTVRLPVLPQNVSEAIQAAGRNVIIKKNVFIKNRDTHAELTPSDCRDILVRALYNPNLVGTTQPIRRPDYKVAIQTRDKNAVVVLDVYAGKDNVEIVGWRKVDAKGLEKMKRQAEREGGQFLILSPNEGSAAALSALPSDVSSDISNLSPGSERYLTEAPSESEGPDLVPMSDNIISSGGKVNALSAEKQETGGESSQGGAAGGAQAPAQGQIKEAAEKAELYSITATTYTNQRGKTSDIYLVKFNRELSGEEKAALNTFVHGPLEEGRKKQRGWYGREQGGYMMRSEEAARQLAGMIGNEEAIADAQPLTAEELREAVAPAEPAEKKPVLKPVKPKKAPVNRVSVEDLMAGLSAKGETRLRDHAEPVKAEEPEHEISDDEMKSLADELRDLLGIGDDEGDAGMKFRDPDGLTPLERQRIQSAGIRLAMGLVERGTTEFADYAGKMVGLLGDKIRPWLKSFYEGARWTPGYEEYAFTPSEQVAAFDVQNFDKKQADPIALADMIVEERKASAAAAQAQRELTETRNKKRKENDRQRESDTGAITGEAERVAAKARTERKNRQSRKKDVTLKPEQPIGDLFADLGNEPQKQKKDERTGNKAREEVAERKLAHSVGADASGTDGGVSAAGAGPTDKGGAAHEAGTGVERGADRPAHRADEDGGLQSIVGNRGRDESGADRGGDDSGVERGGASGTGSVSGRGADGGTEGLSEGESSAVAGGGSGSAAVRKPKKPEVRHTRNFRYDESGNEADGYTPAQRLEANVKAIETLADVLFGNAPATEEQKAIMSRFRGWGQVDLGKYYDVDQILRSTFESAPINRLAKVIKRLDPSGDKKLFEAVKRASLSSYYTPTPIARAMNSFLALSGYRGGSMLDPSMGNGMFEGTLPKSIQERTSITGVELDWLSGQLSRALYPDANVIIGAFEKSEIAPGSFDVVTSNVPFGDIAVNDPTWKNDSTPLKRSAQNRIHNYYAVKMLEAARPGGLVSMMTTSAVMDTKSNQNIRAHIADQGEIVGAVRLPDNTFQGTGVVTDIIFVRKWRDEHDRERTRADESYMETERAFLSQYETTAPNKLDGSEQQVSLNGYYKLNPRNIIGEIQAGNQYGKKDAFGLTSRLTADEIASEVEKAVKRIVGSRRGSLFNPTRTIRETHQAIREAYKGDGDWVSNGNLVVQDGKVGVLTAKGNEYGEVSRTFEGTLKHDKMLPRVESMIDLRNKMKTLIAFEIEGEKEHHIAAVRAELQKAYDNFVGKFGRLQDKDNSFILDDIDGYTLQALEIWKNGNFVGLSDIFTKNSIKPSINLDGKKTPQEAVALSLAEYGYLRPDYLAKALGEDWVEQCGDVVFLKPNSEDDYVTRDEYLSGDVVTKLADARAAAEKDKSFERNVKALEDVQPERIPFDDITIHLGARWIPEDVLNDFVNELLGIHAVYSNRGRKWDPERKMYVNEQKSGVRYIPETDSFEINIEKKELGGEASDWETPKKSAKEILQAALEDKTLVITYKDKEGNTHVDDEQTELANQKIADLRERFETWLPSDPARVDLMEQLYNDRFNRTVIRQFDGSHLIVPGLMGKELRPHQKDAVWMLINNRGGIVDHIVGAGKTLVMQSAIMEMRRMGIAKKPMIVALKSTVAQIAREFKEAFPSARVLAPNDSDFKKENRKKFIANISLNDYDCVILSHEQYCMLPHTEEAERAVIDEQMWQLDNMIEYLYGTNDTSQMTKKQIKALKKRRENLKARLEKRLDRAVDREFCFENLGVDYLFVDESHQFKALPYVTSYQKVAGLGDPQGSNRAVALLTGIRHLQRIHQGDKGTVFLSGTTITNSLVETYNLLNYLRPRKLEELGMPTFDAWASTFAVHTSELEATITGGFALKDRFRQFDNVAELSQLYAEIADVRNDQNLKLPKPGIDAHTVIVPASDAMSEINSEIVNMIESKDGKYFGIYPKDPNRAPWGLHASTISAKAAVSPRLIFPDMNDDGGKVHAVCENVKKYYDEMAEQRGVQLIFCEMGVPGKGKEYDAYTDMVNRFVNDYGIPRSEIAYIQEAPTEEKRKDLFQRVRDGKVRILIGGTKNMGTGVNVQDRITDMHMLTVPWTPAALEQCIGRGGRQGNLVARDFMNNKVRVHYYATEGSLDLYKYQLLDAKGKMITQFKMGTVSGTRSFDEGSADEDGNMDPAEMVAILSGNPVIFEKAKQEKVVKKLRALRNGFERDYQRKKAKYEELRIRKENLERLIRLNDRDRADLEDHGFKPDEKGVYPTTVSINDSGSFYGGGRTFDKPKEAGEYLLSALDKGKDVTLQGFGQRARVAIVNEEKGSSLFSFRELQIGEGNERSIRYSVRLSDDATAAGTAFRNLLKRIVDNGEVYRRNLEEVSSQLSGMNIGEGVFPRQAEYDEAVAKLKELTAEFNKLGKKQETSGDGNRYRDGQEMSDGERLRAIRALEPIVVERNDMSRAELREVYNSLPEVEKDGRVIEFYRSAFKKIYKEDGLFGQVVPVLDEVLKHSVLAYSEEDSLGGKVRPDGTVHKEHDNIIAYDNYVGAVEIASKRYFVRTTVQNEIGRTGTHAFFVSNVDVYENPTESRTIPITSRGTTDFDGIVDAKLQQFFERASSEANILDMRDRIEELSSEMNVPVRIVTDASELSAMSEDGKPRYSRRERRAKGWWSSKDGGIVIVLPNNVNVADVENTFVHEAVGHKGLRALIGEERFDEFLDEVYNHASESIRKTVDRMTDDMVSAEADRLRVRKAQAHERAGEDANASYYSDMAEARTEAEKRREEYRREAMEEYLSDLGGRIGSEGFEKMSQDELTLWGKVKAMVQKFLDKFLRGLKIAKSIRLSDKHLAYILYKSWKNLRERSGGGVFAEAEDAVMRSRTGWDDGMQSEQPVDKKADRSEAALKHLEPSSTGKDGAKVIKNIDTYKKRLDEVAKKYSNITNSRGFLTDLCDSLDIIRNANGSGYRTFELSNGGAMTMRVSNHNANAENADRDIPVVSIVIKSKRSRNTFIVSPDKNVDEYVYMKEDIQKAPAGTLSAIAQSISELLDTGVYMDKTGIARENHSPDDYIVRFRNGDMGLEETITKMKAEAMQANADNLQAKRDAMRAIGGNLNHLRQAMARQREYDITTVKSVADLARILMDNNLLDDLSKYETKRILGALQNSIGHLSKDKDGKIHSSAGPKNYVDQAQRIMDIMVDNQLRMGANSFGRMLSVRGSRVDGRGIEVQGELDPEGQRIAQVVKKSTSLPKDDIDDRIAEAVNRMGSPDQAIADEAAIEYAGLQIARRYVEDITESKAEEKALRDSIKEMESDLKLGQTDKTSFEQYKAATEDAIRQNKIERAEAYRSLVEQMGDVLSESVERAKAWREAEKQRVEEIYHNANSDMEGRPTDEHHKDDRVQKLTNNSLARFVLAPLATFDQMLRMFGKKSSRGEGYLWNRYMRGWVSAAEKEYTGYRDALKVLDAKVSEVFGKDMKWGDLFSLDRKLPKASVRFRDGGEMKEHELTQGNLLYIYMADKMSDGRMKLRRMGITEEDVEDIRNFLDPRFIELADWMQEKFLVDKRNEYNEVHKRMFGASMAAIENYFPLKILANARLEEVDVADDTTDTALPATSTGSIIKRRRNNLALDVTGANAFSVILDHLKQMERWAAFAEFNRDLNTLLSYKRFRNQVMNMSSVYGGGKTLWNNFRNVCSMAAGAYRPPIAALDKSAVNIAKGATMACVNLRVFTALKQFLSMPAYISDSNPVYLAANIANPTGAWRWSMKNLPLFEKRWQSRMAGDPRLLKSEMDWKMWRNRVVELASRVGMAPNAFVDALTVAIGAHAMYQTRLAKYKRYGYDPDIAEERAKQDATILFNQTQQSSEGAFLSTMQVDRSWLSVLFTVFRNSSMSYTRQLYDAIRNIGHRLQPGNRVLSEEFMAKQMWRDGIDPDKATKNAKQEYRRGIIRDLVRIGVFGYVLQLAWNLGAYLPYILLGDDDDEKDKMWDDVFTHTMFGSIEGLTGGDVYSNTLNAWAKGEKITPWVASKDMPLTSDLENIWTKWNNDEVSAMNDVINLFAQSAIGVNPQSLTDAVVAVMDVCGDDAQTSRECALLIARVINCPQSQLDRIYFDELRATGEEASRMTPREIAERYARYKVRRRAPLTGWAYGDKEREAQMDKYRKKSNTLAKESLIRNTDMRAMLDEFEATKSKLSEIGKLKDKDEERYWELRDNLEMSPEYLRYEIIRDYKRDVDELTKEWLNARTAEQRDSCVQAIIGLKREMTREMESVAQ